MNGEKEGRKREREGGWAKEVQNVISKAMDRHAIV